MRHRVSVFEGKSLNGSTLDYKNPLNSMKYTIGIEEESKMENVGDY